MGPTAIRNGRLAYNEAIVESNNQQLLMAAVHERYEENANLLVVSALTANVHVSARADAEIGVGSDSNYRGNLVPFSAGMTYEDNPTITYVPVAGGTYVRQLTAPIDVAMFAQVVRTAAEPDHVYRTLLTSVNGLANPGFGAANPQFERFVDLSVALTRAGILQWTDESMPPLQGVAIAIDWRGTADEREWFALLALTPPKTAQSRVVLPVYSTAKPVTEPHIAIGSRSVYELLEILSMAIDVPGADATTGIAPPLTLGKPVLPLHVAFANKAPQSASVSVPYRGGWFYIDGADQPTKRFFRLASTLWGAMLVDVAPHAPAPVVTVPASR